MERIDKILASLNFGSRKQVHKLIKSKAVAINGEICSDCAAKVNPETDIIEVNGQRLNFKKHLYIMMNKPAGVLSASRDKNGETVLDLLPEALVRKGLFPAGRLDRDAEGLLIITDDGAFAHQMLSPGKKVYKKYFVKTDNPVPLDAGEKFKEGIVFSDGTVCKPATLEICGDGRSAFVSICEGRFHQVKKMFLCCGVRVEYLKRISVGGLDLDENLAPGEARELSEEEKGLIFLGKLH